MLTHISKIYHSFTSCSIPFISNAKPVIQERSSTGSIDILVRCAMGPYRGPAVEVKDTRSFADSKYGSARSPVNSTRTVKLLSGAPNDRREDMRHLK